VPQEPHVESQFVGWLDALERRHMADLQFSEVSRALRALSSTYVERRERLATRSAFDSAGKRAAYALFYGPLHFLTVQGIAASLNDAAGDGIGSPQRILDVGCGTGAAGAAWAAHTAGRATLTGVDAHPWALTEAAFTYASFALDGDVRRAHAARVTIPRNTSIVIVGWMVNELDEASREALLANLLASSARGTRVLIVEPIATRVTPWWSAWAAAFVSRGGRADEWRFRVALPDLLRRLDRAAGLRHDELKARSLFVDPGRST
jgi:SAM-dependent methyltransferase